MDDARTARATGGIRVCGNRTGRRRRGALAPAAALALSLAACTAGTGPDQDPVATPSPTAGGPSSADATGAPSSPSAVTPGGMPFRGAVTTLPTDGLPSPVAAGVLDEPVRVGVPDGSVAGLGDGLEVPLAVTPRPPLVPGTPFDPSVDDPAYRSGLAIWSPTGGVEWLLAAPPAPETGTGIGQAALSDDWVAWFAFDSGWWADTSYVLWTQPRSGGPAREIASAPGASAESTGPYLFDRDPVILGDVVLWLGEAGAGAATAAYVAPLDGSAPPRQAVADAVAMWRDACVAVDELAFFVVTGVSGERLALHRLVVDAAGETVAETTVRSDLAGPVGRATGVSACGDTVAVARATGEGPSLVTWLEVERYDEVHTFVWPSGVGSSVADVTVTPSLVTWAAYNGADEGGRYLFDVWTATLYELPRAPGFAHVAANGSLVHWVEAAEDGISGVDVVAPVVPRGGKA